MAAAKSHLQGLMALVPLVGPDSGILPPHEHKDLLLVALQKGFLAKSARTPQQNWVHLFHYLPASLVKWLQEEECAMLKTDKVMAFLVERGLHSPSEPTLAAVTVLVNYQKKQLLLQPSHSHNLFLRCKSRARAYLENHVRKMCKFGGLQELPSDPYFLEAPNPFFQEKPLLPSFFPPEHRDFNSLVACVPLRSNHGDLVQSKRGKGRAASRSLVESAVSHPSAALQLSASETSPLDALQPTEKPVLEEALQPTEKPVLQEAFQPTEKPVLQEALQLVEKPVLQEALQLAEKPVLQEALQLAEKPVLQEALQEALELPPQQVQETRQLVEQPVQESEVSAPRLSKKRSLTESVAELAKLRTQQAAAKKGKQPKGLEQAVDTKRPPATPQTSREKPSKQPQGTKLEDVESKKDVEGEQSLEVDEEQHKKKQPGKKTAKQSNKPKAVAKKQKQQAKKQTGKKAVQPQKTKKDKKHKTPRANTTPQEREAFLKSLPPKVLQAFKGGCSKCRWRPYCTVCCWKHRGY
ncbi:unnamed protein product [Symbiodinium microadriaticum]|nr:unnamed protein product [Symbiodinium microadriaticum]